MSLQARQKLIASPNTVFRAQSQRDDLLNDQKTSTDLIALLLDLVGKGHIILFTAVRTDHSDDSCLGFHSHANGFCADVWPLSAPRDGAYLNADTHDFRQFLADAAASPWLYQIGLAGSANTPGDATAAGSSEFTDDGADHVHLGANG